MLCSLDFIGKVKIDINFYFQVSRDRVILWTVSVFMEVVCDKGCTIFACV